MFSLWRRGLAPLSSISLGSSLGWWSAESVALCGSSRWSDCLSHTLTHVGSALKLPLAYCVRVCATPHSREVE